MATELKNKTLVPSKAPNLPIAPTQYSQQYQDQLNNTHRLYHAQVDNITQALSTPNSGTTANRPINTSTPKLQTGQYYFDTSLSPAKPIWWNGTAWVDATGTVV